MGHFVPILLLVTLLKFWEYLSECPRRFKFVWSTALIAQMIDRQCFKNVHEIIYGEPGALQMSNALFFCAKIC